MCSVISLSLPILLSGRELAAREFTGCWGESTTITLLNRHRVKQPSKYVSMYPQSRAALSTHQRSIFVHWVVVASDAYSWSRCRE